ncbi:hypothetical protein ACFVVQ_00700 [Paenibacillus chitinolyticus]|uniref:hypothetical protein n=1 Tax=Paenibacillus chitinolyticus TaxID=79263 RepID=UPI0036D97220
MLLQLALGVPSESLFKEDKATPFENARFSLEEIQQQGKFTQKKVVLVHSND